MTVERPPMRPIRKDEIDLQDRGIYVESWLPERRSRRKPLLLIHGELGGSWLWERYLGYFAGRGWEAHALNLRGHYWSATTDMSEPTIAAYAEDATAVAERLPPAVVIGHGMGALIALKVAEARPVAGIVLISPPVPAPIRDGAAPHILRELPPVFRRDHIGWGLTPELLRRRNPDLSLEDTSRVRHMLSAESGAARRDVLAGVHVDREALAGVPALVLSGGLDALYPASDAARVAEWLGASYATFDELSHYGLVIGDATYTHPADAIRHFLEVHKL